MFHNQRFPELGKKRRLENSRTKNCFGENVCSVKTAWLPLAWLARFFPSIVPKDRGAMEGYCKAQMIFVGSFSKPANRRPVQDSLALAGGYGNGYERMESG